MASSFRWCGIRFRFRLDEDTRINSPDPLDIGLDIGMVS